MLVTIMVVVIIVVLRIVHSKIVSIYFSDSVLSLLFSCYFAVKIFKYLIILKFYGLSLIHI